LCLGAFGVLLVNPTPFPYNLIHFLPYAFLVAYRYAAELASGLEPRCALGLVAGALVVFAHLGPFGAATARHFHKPNDRQLRLVRLAEDLTHPEKDPVFDGTFMVPTRPIVHPASFLHSLTIDTLRREDGPRLRDMLERRPAAVFIPNYRTDWLTSEDQAYFREHYVSLADDFWVLGAVLPAGGGEFEVIHPGRYLVTSLEQSRLAGTYANALQGLMAATKPLSADDPVYAGTLDGKALTPKPVELSIGKHQLDTGAATNVAVVWVGPKLDRPPVVGFGDHRRLFINWY
jgi:hypothetical protein